MSAFFSEDTVAFKTDRAIIGVVECTWSDVDSDAVDDVSTYVHKTLPSKARQAYLKNSKLLPGYVIVAFMDDYDGHCLVSEDSLEMIDRAMAVGDVVKKSLSNAQSGTIISTSLMCELQPQCSEAQYNTKQPIQAQGHTPSHGPKASKHRSSRDRPFHGFPDSAQGPALFPANEPQPNPSLRVPAQELAHWSNYREEDFVIYQDWVGQVEEVFDEVTVRLTNGSVVVVEDPEELEEPLWVPGSKSYELIQRLDRAGYYQCHSSEDSPKVGTPGSTPAEPCYPGQMIQTKKGNLRRGRWKFGAYDPEVSPQGMVADVRCIQLEVRWLYPNQSLALRDQASPPSTLLGLDEVESGLIGVYNRSRLPRSAEPSTASYGPDTGFGHRVRFRDLAGAAVKYSPRPSDLEATTQHFNRVPRAATQGFDMNVLRVTSTSTKVKVRWQDWSVTLEDSVHLFPYVNPDEHDVWPGDRVSLKTEERSLGGNGPGSIRANKIGVVQSVDAPARIAKVRWYQDPHIDMDDEKVWQTHGSTYGNLGADITEVSLYDIAAHDALQTNLGDMAILLPVSARSLAPNGLTLAAAIFEHFESRSRSRASSGNDAHSSGPHSPTQQDVAPADFDWFGEMVDMCLDGEVVVRLGATDEVRDIRVPPERILVISSDNLDSESEDTFDEEEDFSDEMSVSAIDSDLDPGHISSSAVSFEYGGGKKLNSDEDEEMWSTDEDENMFINDNDKADEGNAPARSSPTLLRPATTTKGREIVFSSYPNMPPQFFILESSPPTDHHYVSTTWPLTADIMRRIMKETNIMRNSLPDGVFVRSWDTRPDLLRIMIVGPQNTPYEFAPFAIDLQYGVSFPTSPPDVFFHSWTNSIGRINPNLYEDGKICLSLLGTWDGDNRNEEWSAKNSTVLQLVVSLMGLVLVKEPYFNEAGFDVLIGSEDSKIPSALYNEKVYVMSKGFVKTALSTPPQGLEDIVRWLYLPSKQPGPQLLERIVKDSHALLPETNSTSVNPELAAEQDGGVEAGARLSAGALILLRRNLEWLQDRLIRDAEHVDETTR